VPDVADLAKAELRQLDANFKNTIKPDTWCKVQFNPETLKVSFANQLVQPDGQGDQRGGAARQFVGSSTTKLALTLWFDVGSPQSEPPVTDVRRLTEKVAYFIRPDRTPGKKKPLPPAVRFVWGTFQFDGVMDSLEETLEYFSAEGKPLRASLAVTLLQQDIQFAFNPDFKEREPTDGAAPATPGTAPLTQAPADGSVQGLADAAGKGGDWQSIAAANGIENPRALAAGAILDLDLRAPTVGGGIGFGGGFGIGGGIGVEASSSVGGGGQLDLDAGFLVASPSLAFGAGAGIGLGASASIGSGG
jgi:hypothetical protein